MTKNKKIIIEGLKYIADSPSKKYGGFHENTIEIAKSALCYISKLRANQEKAVRDARIKAFKDYSKAVMEALLFEFPDLGAIVCKKIQTAIQSRIESLGGSHEPS